MTVCMVISLPKILQKYRKYTVYTYKCMVLANPTHKQWWVYKDVLCV
jgi:hypothetical protein